MSDEDVTLLIQQVCGVRNEDAASRLWDVYFQRLLAVARRNLNTLPTAVADEEDVALSAMNSLFRAAEGGRLSSVQNRDELWKMLLTITLRKVNRHAERVMAMKRGGPGEASGGMQEGLSQDALYGIPDSRFLSDLLLESRELIELLPDEILREIVLARLEGYTVEEIADRRGVAVSTIERKLARIRALWARQLDQ